MSKVTDGETRTILKKLAIIIFMFYLMQYIVCLSMARGLNVWEYPAQDGLDTQPTEASTKYSVGLLPFWHFDCGFPEDLQGIKNIALTSWISMVISQLCLILMIFKIVASTAHAWDYSVTISFFHFVVTCAATRAFPVTWAWWVTLLVSTLIVSVVSELMCYFLHDLRDIEKT